GDDEREAGHRRNVGLSNAELTSERYERYTERKPLHRIDPHREKIAMEGKHSPGGEGFAASPKLLVVRPWTRSVHVKLPAVLHPPGRLDAVIGQGVPGNRWQQHRPQEDRQSQDEKHEDRGTIFATLIAIVQSPQEPAIASKPLPEGTLPGPQDDG